MNSSIDYAEALLRKARDDGYVVRCMSGDAAGEDEPTIQRAWALAAIDRARLGGSVKSGEEHVGAYPRQCYAL